MTSPTPQQTENGCRQQWRAGIEREIRASYRFMQEAADNCQHELANTWLQRAHYLEQLLLEKQAANQ